MKRHGSSVPIGSLLAILALVLHLFDVTGLPPAHASPAITPAPGDCAGARHPAARGQVHIQGPITRKPRGSSEDVFGSRGCEDEDKTLGCLLGCLLGPIGVLAAVLIDALD